MAEKAEIPIYTTHINPVILMQIIEVQNEQTVRYNQPKIDDFSLPFIIQR